jgi:cytochrome c
MRLQARSALLATALALVAGASQAAPSPEIAAGRKIALRACGGCHAVDRGDSPLPGAPQFRSLGQRMSIDDLPSRFQDGMMASHSRMPVVRLGADEVVVLTAYLKSVQRKPKAAV